MLVMFYVEGTYVFIARGVQLDNRVNPPGARDDFTA